MHKQKRPPDSVRIGRLLLKNSGCFGCFVLHAVFAPLHAHRCARAAAGNKGLNLAQRPKLCGRVLLTDFNTVRFLGLGVHKVIKHRAAGDGYTVEGLRLHRAGVENCCSANVRQNRYGSIFRGNAYSARARRGGLVGQHKIFERYGKCAVYCGNIYMIFTVWGEKVWRGYVLFTRFKIQLITDWCAFGYGDFRRFSVFTLWTLYALLTAFAGIAFFALDTGFALVALRTLNALFASRPLPVQ